MAVELSITTANTAKWLTEAERNTTRLRQIAQLRAELPTPEDARQRVAALGTRLHVLAATPPLPRQP